MAAAGADVTLLIRSNRQAQLAGGVRITSPLGDATIPVKTITAGTGADPFDVIVLTNKAYGLDGALEAIARANDLDSLRGVEAGTPLVVEVERGVGTC